MDFSCCSKRKSDKKCDNEKKKMKKRSDILELIQNFSKSIEIECSYILCGQKGIRPLKKQATIGKNIYYFCSTECWEDWLKEYDVKNYAVSPSSLDSPEYINKYTQEINTIPPLFI